MNTETIPGGRYRVNGVLVNAEGEPLKGEAAKEPEREPEGGSLDGVDFASEAAREAAQEASLWSGDFKDAKPSSPNGFTKPDVQTIVDAQG